MGSPPKGRGRKSNIEAYRDAMAIVKLVDHDCMEVADAAKALGLRLSTAYRLLSRARGVLLKPQIEADKKAAEPKVNQWFEPVPAPEPVPSSAFNADPEMGGKKPPEPEPPSVAVPAILPDVQPEPTPVSDPEFITLPDGTKRRIRPQEPSDNEIVYEWSHVMDYSSFRVKTPWRQQQLIAQWKENEALGGKHTNLRGGPKNKNCFRGCPSYQCLCEDNL
jgi:hypothetical protein